MKSIILLIALTLASVLANAQNSKDAWKDLLNKPKLAEYFNGLYNTLGIHVKETNEYFTVHHKGDHFEITDGVDSASTDYVVSIGLENITNMQKHGDDAEIDAYESYRIMSVLFTPLTAVALKHKMFEKSFQQKLAGIENHIHVYLQSPTNDEYVVHTLLYINDHWLVIPGAHGKAKRVFRISPDEAIEYQRKVFAADQSGKRSEWRKFKKWYLKWRKEVSSDCK